MNRSQVGFLNPSGSPETFESLREAVLEATRRGRFEQALALCDRAAELAEHNGDERQRDLVLLNRCAVLISREQLEGVGGILRRLLLRSLDPDLRFLAAYNLARYHQQAREIERGLFYARLALEQAPRTERSDYLANAHHQVGSLLLVDCHFEEARSHYEQALTLACAEEVDTEHAICISNLGYCEVMLGCHRRGFERLFESLRLMRRLDSGNWAMLPHLGLSYAYLDIRKLEAARRHAERALALATSAQHRDHTMNALYLLGEAEKLRGRELSAFECFSRLQREFHPEQPYIADFLMTTDIRPLIHLMA
jgi:tetratricopeptide (TPR) repeat protein